MSRPSYLAALDVGTSKVAAAIAEITTAGELAVIGLGLSETSGVRRGVVVDLQDAIGSILRAIVQAELMAGVRVDRAHVGLPGAHVVGFNSRGVVSVAGDDHVITAADLARAVDAALPVELPNGREIVHILPQDFVVDDRRAITAPLGLTGIRLEANVYVATVHAQRALTVVDAVNGAGLVVQDLALGSLAAGEAVLTDEEKSLGVGLIDVGASATQYAIFEGRALVRSGSVSIGGNHFTAAIAVALRTRPPDAETLKRRCGRIGPCDGDDFELIDVPSLGSPRVRRMPQRVLSAVLELQASQLFHAVREEMCRHGFASVLPAGIVVTGGGSIPDGMASMAERVFHMPVRCRLPSGIDGLTGPITAPAFATAVGLLLHAHRHPTQAPLTPRDAGAGRLFRGRFAADRMATRAS